ASERCTACRSDSPSVTAEEIAELHPQVSEWQLIEEDGIRKLDRGFRVRNFRQALMLANAIGEKAEEEGHHPRLVVEWGRVRVTWWTHKIRNLHRNDFIMAARTDQAFADLLAKGEIEQPAPRSG
ncbi:MAG TPA: 4a-hydroxytetrahydrobiopterin dehydratase, partial [Dehalococcoidia bacterium]|nr:4a-hydroxytetrahydrobiopterin dehydratase [Dehalococcoidia bacterium]